MYDYWMIGGEFKLCLQMTKGIYLLPNIKQVKTNLKFSNEIFKSMHHSTQTQIIFFNIKLFIRIEIEGRLLTILTVFGYS